MRHEMKTLTGVVVKPDNGDWYYLHVEGPEPTEEGITHLIALAKQRLVAEATPLVLDHDAELNGWTVDSRGRIIDGPFGEKPPLGAVPDFDQTPCPGCGEPMGYHDAEGFCL